MADAAMDISRGKHSAGAHAAPAGASLVVDQSAAAYSRDTWTPASAKKKSSVGRILASAGIAFATVLTLLGVAYGGGYYYFTNHFYPHSTIAGTDISLKTAGEVASIAESVGNNYHVSVTGSNATFNINASDVAAGVDGAKVAQRALAANDAVRWPVNMRGTYDYSALIIDEFNAGGFNDELEKQIQAFNDSADEPKDAYIEFDENTMLYSVHPEETGSKIKAAPVLAAAAEAVLTMQSEVTIPDDAFIEPEIKQDDERLVNAVNEANNYSKANINLVLGSTEIPAGSIGSAQISKWVSIGDDYKVHFDEEAMNAWIEELAYGLDTVGTERSYTRPDGAKFTVSGGLYGWEIDRQALIDQVRDGIKDGMQGNLVVPTFSEGATWNGIGVPDWGAYVDVSIGEQHARYYDESGNLVWEADVVSGTPDGEHDTPYGIWRILYKESPSVLKGEIQEATNQPEYETEVKYWMPFTYQGHGFHDATWQWAFGGDRYANGAGSHGCLNLSYSDAERLYELIGTGNAVIIHG